MVVPLAMPTWRNELVAWTRSGTVDRFPGAPAIAQLARRLQLDDALTPALTLWYGAYLCGAPGAPPGEPRSYWGSAGPTSSAHLPGIHADSRDRPGPRGALTSLRAGPRDPRPQLVVGRRTILIICRELDGWRDHARTRDRKISAGACRCMNVHRECL